MHSTLGVTAVKQDLAITAYKPSKAMEAQFFAAENPSESAWSFVADHLEKLPIVRSKDRNLQYIAERDPEFSSIE